MKTLIALICVGLFAGCTPAQQPSPTIASINVSGAGGDVSVFVIEIEGRKFVLAVGYSKVALAPLTP